mmetsp:Transcript_15942/g.21076  ORF Transcript_15942/g.21076 Transcript_15942/m.21076 type:complete len:90 (-) Transcript_15942:404-673(-)
MSFISTINSSRTLKNSVQNFTRKNQFIQTILSTTSYAFLHFRRMSTNIGDPVPINFYKDGQDPLIKPDEDYPDWMWNLKQPSLAELKKN